MSQAKVKMIYVRTFNDIWHKYTIVNGVLRISRGVSGSDEGKESEFSFIYWERLATAVSLDETNFDLT